MSKSLDQFFDQTTNTVYKHPTHLGKRGGTITVQRVHILYIFEKDEQQRPIVMIKNVPDKDRKTANYYYLDSDGDDYHDQAKEFAAKYVSEKLAR